MVEEEYSLINVLNISSKEWSHKFITKFLDQISRTHKSSEEEICISFPMDNSVLFILYHKHTVYTKVHVQLALNTRFKKM